MNFTKKTLCYDYFFSRETEIYIFFYFQPQQQGQSNDCETLDLSMPRRRESAATPPTFQRDMPLPSHRKSPSFASMSSAAAAGKISTIVLF